jgi:hypothetical protein
MVNSIAAVSGERCGMKIGVERRSSYWDPAQRKLQPEATVKWQGSST